MAASRKVEAIHPLTAAQEGILFHSLYAPSSGVYAAQLSCRFIGDLDVEAFRAAWRWLMHRHPVLRASFLWEELEQPVQVVSREVEVPLTVEDLRQLPAEKQAEAVEAFLARERERDFEPERAPLFRLTLLRLADDVYRFVWSRHHLILDGWSLAIVLEELFAIYTHGVYDHGVAGREPELPAPRPYRDYLRWLKQQDQEAAEHFWRRTLKGIEGPTPLWGERDPAGRDAEHRGEENKKLSTTATARIEEWARRLQVTPSTVVQGAWAALLSRLSGEEDVVFGVVVSGRPPALPGVDSMVGMFINTLPCRVRVAPRQVVSQWLDSLRQSQMAIEAHGHAPLVRVQGWSDVPAGTALFDSIVAFENYPLDRLALRDLAGLKVRQVEAGEATSYALALQITPGERLALGIEYDAGRFSPISIRRTLAHVEALLDSMGRRPQQRLGDLSLLSPSAQHQLKVEWNTPPAPQHPVATLAIDRITQQMQERPDAVAVVAEGEVASYDELGRRSRCLAEALMASGLEPETPIGVLAERSVEMVVGLLGVLRAGAAFLPLDPTDPEERLRFVLEDAGVRLLLTQQRLATLSRAIAPPDRCRTVWLDAGGPGLTPSPALTRPQPVADLRREQAAYVIYTSGSTGRPKGVVISHSAMSNILHHRATGCDARDAKLQKTALSFDVAVAEIFLPLMVGGRTVLARPGGHYDGEYLTDLLRRERVTLAAFPPSTLGPILDAWQLSDCPALRTVGVGGDVVPSDLPARFHAQSDAALHNRYGPTEATIFMTEWRCQRQTHHPSAKASPLPIGRPAGGAQVHLVDDRLTPMPVAVAGELTVGGACLARGYLDRPALTAQRFVPDPFTYGGRLYRTGDLARYRDDGAIEFLGRSDQQIKIRGFRVELGEVESVLAAHPTVQETAVVFRRDDATANGQLIAYVVAPSRNGDLRHFLQQQLPDYMVPKALVHLDRLPLTSSGKVDRQALERRALPAPATAPTSARSLPQTDREKVLAEIWRAVLRHETIGIDDNFFELGGDSILSLQVVTRARQAGLEISPRLLFEHPTIGQLAEVARHPSGTREAPPESGELPLSPIQQWFFEQDFAEPWHWNQSVLLRPRSSLEMPRIVRVLTQLTARHAALRCRFQHQQGVWLQEISPVPGPPPALEIDLTSLLATDQPAVMARITAELQASLDLASGPLQRLALFRLAVAIGDRLLWLVHHLAVDAVSWRILLEEFELIYHLEAANDTPPLPPATSSLASWHQQARGLAESTDLATGRLGQWTDRPWSLVPSLPVDGTRTGINAEHTSQKVTTWLPAAHVKRLLRRAPKAYRASVEELLVAALAQAYHGWTGSRWLSLDLEGHGREEIAEGLDLSRTVGWFTALYPVLLELPEKGDAESAVRVGLIKEQLRGYAGRDFSLLRFLGPDSARQRLAELPSPEMLFNYLGQIDAAQTASSLFELAPESSGPDHSPRAQRRHLLEWTAAILDRQLRIELRYGADVHHRSTVEALAEDFLNALRDLIDPTASEQLPRFTPADFPAAAIDQPALDRLVAQFEGEGEGQPHPRIEALYPLSPMQEGLPRPALEALFPLSPMQEGMLFHSLLAPQSGIFTGRLSCRLQGELDREAFRRAWERLVERHGVFRTAFAWEGLERPLQGVLESVELPLASLDWRSLPSAEQKVRWEQLRTADSALDLARPPLMRLTLARIADGAWRFAWTFHHLLLDGWSLAAVLQELFTLYEAEASNTPPRLPPARPFSHYVDWLAVQDLAPTKAYWRRLLRGFESPTPLGVDRSPPDGSELGAGTEEATRLLSTEVSAGLKALGQQHRVTSSILVQTAWSVLLSRYGETSDVVFGIVVSGRPPALKGVQSMVGLLINTLPVRVSVAPTGSLPVLLRELQQQQLASLELQHTPLVRIQNWSEIPANGPLFHSIVAFENYPIDAAVAALEGPLQVHDLSTVESSNYPLNLMVLPVRGQADTPERLRFRLLYDPERFDVATVHRLLGHAETVLAAMASDVDLPLGDLPLLTAAERTQVLREWNDTARPWSNDRLLHQLFEDQVAQQPDAVAVIDAYGEILDYGELNRRANRLAHALRRLGIGPGRPVAIHLEPSVHMVAAVLAVLKAGGAYVPLALSFPAGRIEWILGALNISCLITESARLPALDKLWERLPNLENILCPSPWPGKDEALATEVSAPVSLLRRRDLAAY
ncbi:MAG: amino acid adenylation domain-containing protein, partial [Acidobacteriota bacterium]